MYERTQSHYHYVQLHIMSGFINRLSLLAAVVLCLATLDAVAQSVGPFPGISVDARTIKTQMKVDKLYDQGEFQRAHLIYRNDLAPIGDKYAQYMVGYMYLTGTGVDEDAVLGSAWYRLAAERAYKGFIDERDQILAYFTDVDLVRSDTLYLQLRRQYSDVVLLLDLVKDDLDVLADRTGSRLSGGGSPVTIFDLRSGSSVSADQYFGQVNKRIESRLKRMAKQLDMPNLNTDPDKVDVKELETIVQEFVNTINDR